LWASGAGVAVFVGVEDDRGDGGVGGELQGDVAVHDGELEDGVAGCGGGEVAARAAP
jgi:hypothetical protein